MSLTEAAAALAKQAHEGQHRKGGRKVPSFTHLHSVAERLRAFGYHDELTLSAAYLHDLLEDQPAFADRLRAEVSADVIATVEALTEPKHDAAGKKLPKERRVTAYIEGLTRPTEAARRAIPISCADKVDNLHSLLESERVGEQLLVQLSTRPGQQRRHLATLRAIYAPVVTPPLLAAYDAAVRELHTYIDAWLPGRAVAIAAAAHLGQFDRAGAPYILHPLRLMMRASGPSEQMAAVLHDVVEDSAWTLAELTEEGFPEDVLAALDRLTKRPGEPYEDFIARILAPPFDPLAARVKLLDLEDNMSIARLGTLEEGDLQRLHKYHRARARILLAL